MSQSNQSLKIIECPRDAMQGLKDFIPTELKANYINLLLKAGFDTLLAEDWFMSGQPILNAVKNRPTFKLALGKPKFTTAKGMPNVEPIGVDPVAVAAALELA